MTEPITIPINQIKEPEGLYPRSAFDPEVVQTYQQAVDLLPPIEVNQDYKLIDGKHRLEAHRAEGRTEIAVTITPTETDAEFLLLACQRNAAHGLQLNRADKQRMARSIYHATGDADRPAKKEELERVMSVSRRTLDRWLGQIDKDAAAERKAKAYELWLAFHTQQEIAVAVGVSQPLVSEWEKKFISIGHLSNSDKSNAEFADWNRRNFGTCWQWQGKSNRVDHLGNTEQEIVERLIRMYTMPFEGVVDPFAGGGPTIDICRKRHRRYWASDLTPPSVRADVRQHDIVAGIPHVPDWQNTRLVYLDPPYWKQAFESDGTSWYGDDPHNLANMDLDEFHETLADIILEFADRLYIGAKIALIIAPTQWRSPTKPWPVHHAEAIRDLIKASRRPMRWRTIQCPYPLSMYNEQMMAWERENSEALESGRELTVWEV